MSDSAVIDLLPSISEKQRWTDQQKAVMESLGLRGEKNVQRNGSWTKVTFEAPDSIVEAFRYQVQRTGLDPVARQIYCIERGGKWGIQISIDGFRLIAERSKEYRGQTPAQWTDGKLATVPLREDGKVVRDAAGNPVMVEDFRWVDVWTDTTTPAAARVGVYRDGFAEAMWAVATFAGYAVTDRDGNLTGQWKTNGANQLAKCAEMLALRKAFPQELSGLYGTEEMEQAGNPRSAAPAPSRASEPIIATVVEDARDWAAEIAAAGDWPALDAVYGAAQQAGAFATEIVVAGATVTVKEALFARKAEIEKEPQPVVDVEPEPETPRDWVAEAKQLKTKVAVVALSREAMAADAPTSVLKELGDIATALDTAALQPESGENWAEGAAEAAPDEWSETPAVLVEDVETAAADAVADEAAAAEKETGE